MRTKKSISLLLTMILVSILLPAQVFGAGGNIIVVKLGSPWMGVNGAKKEIDPGRNTTPKTIQGRTMVPVKAIVEGLGGTAGWQPLSKMVDITLGETNIKLWLDKKDAMVDGNQIFMDVPAMSINGRTMIPLRFVAESLGAKVVWNNNTQEATISLKGSNGVKPNNTQSGSEITSWQYIVFNDVEIPRSDFVVKDDNENIYVYISTEKLQTALKYPSYYRIANPYPKIRVNNGKVNVFWEDGGEEVLGMAFKVGSAIVEISSEVDTSINESVDIGMITFERNGKIFIPVAIFAAIFGMDISEDHQGTLGFIQFTNDFPASDIIGQWSDSHTDLYNSFKDISSGVVGLSSSEQGYIFKNDGTYTSWIMSVGGFKDGFAQQKGKYMISGNTIICYGRVETYYEGRPLILKYKDKPLEKESYEYIGDYRPDEGKIKIGGTWLHFIK